MTTTHEHLILPLIDLSRCTGCGLCEQLCPTQAVAVQRNRAVIIHPNECSFCEVCESYCPEGAIGRPFTIAFAPEERSNGGGLTPL
jgi:MinD superfamily P-loop ATPase